MRPQTTCSQNLEALVFLSQAKLLDNLLLRYQARDYRPEHRRKKRLHSSELQSKSLRSALRKHLQHKEKYQDSD